MYRLSQLNEYLRIHVGLFMNLQLANDEGVLDQELTLPSGHPHMISEFWVGR